MLAGAVVVGFFATLIVTMLRPIPHDSQALVNVLIGTLAAGLGQVLGYYFGSSRNGPAPPITSTRAARRRATPSDEETL